MEAALEILVNVELPARNWAAASERFRVMSRRVGPKLRCRVFPRKADVDQSA